MSATSQTDMTDTIAAIPARRSRSWRTLLPSPADYRQLRTTWRKDLVAGLTVGIVALPLALGFGVSSGVTAEAGLVTAIVAGMLAAFFGGSNVQVSGPTGAMAVVLLPIVATQGAGVVATIAVIAGLMVIAAGVLRLGRVVSFIPWPVIEGFTMGIGVIIALQQVPLLTSATQAGVGEHSSNTVIAALQSLAEADPGYLPWSLATAGIVAACMLLAPRIHPAIPGSLVGIVLVTVVAALVDTPLAVIGALPHSLPMPSLPHLTPGLLVQLLPAAATVAALAAIESLLSARVAASMDDTGPYDPDRELIGQGIASVGSGFFGGMPATAALARTAVNVRSGGRSRLASMTHAVVLLLVVLVAAGPVGAIPLAALAGILLVTAVRMVNITTARSIMRSTKADAFGFVITFIVTLAFDLIVAVVVGMVVLGVVAIRNMVRATDVSREPIRGDDQPGDEQIAILRFDGPLIFASSEKVFDAVMHIDGVTVVILRMSQLELIDASGARVLSEIVVGLERRGITVLLKGVQPGHEQIFRAVGVLDSLRHHNHLFVAMDDALAHARSHVARRQAALEGQGGS
ncbi:SulP family inorganic anion transporter [Propionibacteriaceae bacterium G1746]|uniref:SulP family inorganic anion transporter n=1 Tax=Aestuariimicrobium sp. G57 TaxID=3418485 RepID=UPI003C1FB533